MKIEERRQEFLEERGPDEIDLCQEVKMLFINSGLGNKISILDNYINTNNIANKKPNIQRFYLNKFFNYQLILFANESIEQRSCLITDGTVNDWLRLFKTKIMPFMIEYDLPMNL